MPSNQLDQIDFHEIRGELAKTSEIWQYRLLTHDELTRFSRDMALSIFNAEVIVRLWQAGLIRADMVRSATPVTIEGLRQLSVDDDGVTTYLDERPVPHRPNGYGDVFENVPAMPDDVELYFHPFRSYVLHHVVRVFKSNTSATQYLQSRGGLERLARVHVEELDRWSSSTGSAERFEYWNQIAELAIACEPPAYETIFHGIRWNPRIGLEETRALIEAHFQRVSGFLVRSTKEQVDEMRADLVRSAEILDGNKMAHVLVRLMNAHERLRLKDRFGLAVLFTTMAECIRRVAERALRQEFPEEDQIGFGQWMEGARKQIYGTDRVTDATDASVREFLSSIGLNAGVRVRFYVEGETELGALISAVGSGGIEYVNLRGQVVQRGGRGLAFVESLERDKEHGIFSMVMLDQDRGDFVRALKKAAQDERFFGRFWLSNPDVEFANFDGAELCSIVVQLLRDRGAAPVPQEVLARATRASSGREFFKTLSSAGVRDAAKGETWGEALMAYAIKHPTLPSGHRDQGKKRPVFDAAEVLVRARQAGYLRHLERFRTDPESGDLVEKRPKK